MYFPTGLTGYDYEPYTMQNVLQYNGKFYVCGTGRQTLIRSKTSNDNYYLLTMAAIAQEIRYRREERKTDVVLAAGLPLASFGREKKGFREYLFRKEQPLRFRYEDESYEIRIQDVKLFPQGAGHGLIRCSGNLVPFENSFPRNTKLYRLMTTKPGEA